MSLKRTAFRSGHQGTVKEMPTIDTGSYNGCSVDWSESDSESDFDRRFWQKVERRSEDECWPWTGNRITKTGRGQVHIRWDGKKNVRRYAPVVAWELTHRRATPAGCVIAHLCDNPNCVNPSHLSAVPQAENVRDSVRKGRYNAYGVQKLNADQVVTIRARGASGEAQASIAADFGIARNTVSQILNHVSWAHLQTPAVDLANVVPLAPEDLQVPCELFELSRQHRQPFQSRHVGHRPIAPNSSVR